MVREPLVRRATAGRYHGVVTLRAALSAHLWVPVLLLDLVACRGGEPQRPPVVDTEPVVVDTDTDTDEEGGLYRPPDDVLDCDASYDTPLPGGAGAGSCVTEVIACGAMLRATQAGGSTAYGAEPGQPLSECAGVASGTSTLSGVERVYQLDYPATVRSVRVELDSCERSWLLWHEEPELACPTSLVPCEYAPNGDFHAQWAEVGLNRSGRIFFVIEGDGSDGGNYELRVDCFE